jgi:hypothetical protein
MALCLVFVPFNTLLDFVLPVSTKPNHTIFTNADYEEGNNLAYTIMSISMKKSI